MYVLFAVASREKLLAWFHRQGFNLSQGLALVKFKGYSTFLEIGSFYNSLRVKHLGFTVFESILPIL